MTALYKFYLFYYLYTFLIYNAYCYKCNEEFDPSTCVYKIACNEIPNNIYQYAYGSRSDLQEMYGIDSSICKFIYIPNYDTNCFPIHLKYIKKIELVPYSSHTVTEEYVPSNENTDMLSLITTLDLSNSNYYTIPTLKSMKNLEYLQLTGNMLTVAYLCNKFELPLLTEINLSHNIISDIQYNTDLYKFDKLKQIDLSFNNLTKMSKALFDPFGTLEKLDLSHNFIDAISSFTFEGLKNLVYLNISHNQISDINSSLFRFNVLEEIDLSYNNIKIIKTTDFEQLTNLNTLKLNNNFISILEKNTFLNMLRINSLFLQNNMLENIDKDSFITCPLLKNINISNNKFRTLQRGLFKNLSIANFSIKDNSLEGAIVKGSFAGLSFVSELDLSNQRFEEIDDYAFNGLVNISVLLLNNNMIKTLSLKSFKTVTSLKHLELSFNKIGNINFEKDDLYNLLTLSMKNNDLTFIKQNDLHGLSSLQFLDLSNNKIKEVETNSFNSLRELINFQISNNPLSGVLKESTFDGMHSLPSLDISCTFLSNVRNGSFKGMIQLSNLNMSHSKIDTLEFNSFVYTSNIRVIDLSYNRLKEFIINNTDLVHLHILYINNNLLKQINYISLQKLSELTNVYLSFNMIQNIDTTIFGNMKQLRLLDLSYNTKLKCTLELLNTTKSVDMLNLSGITTDVSFDNIRDLSLSKLTMSNANISNVDMLHLNGLQHLKSLVLANNSITKLTIGGFNNLSILRNLDVSYNKISSVQPGVFRDTVMLENLNLSHNLLNVMSYGIFHGLIYLKVLDISYNYIRDLKNERFYEVNNLEVLIADHNKIESIDAEEFHGTILTQLSIGDNPIPCEDIINMKRREVSFQITAIRLNKNNDENFEGISCNKKIQALDKTMNTPYNNSEILLSIRNILLQHFNNYETITSTGNPYEKYLINISDQLQKLNTLNTDDLHISNDPLILAKNNETNVLLRKILNVLQSKPISTPPPVLVTKNNATYENLLAYINEVKRELEKTLKEEKNSILNEVNGKVSEVNTRVNNNLSLQMEMSKHEKLTSMPVESKSLFTETCVALILIILVGFVLFKIYKSKIYVRQSFSVSTRELPGAMDSTL